MADQAEKLRELAKNFFYKGKVIAITSGKGGVGKTNVAVNLAIALSALKKKVLLIDFDLGLANADIILNVIVRHNISHILKGQVSIEEAIINAPGRFSFLAGASGLKELVNIPPEKRATLLHDLSELQNKYDFILIDTGAGVSDNVVSVLNASDEVLLITTPEPTAIVDAYAVAKIMSLNNDIKIPIIKLIVNMSKNSLEASKISESIISVANKFLGVYIEKLGYILHDPSIPSSVRRKQPLLLRYPSSSSSKNISKIAKYLNSEVVSQPDGKRNLSFFQKFTHFFQGN